MKKIKWIIQVNKKIINLVHGKLLNKIYQMKMEIKYRKNILKLMIKDGLVKVGIMYVKI